MPTFTAREVRAWALANDINCPPRGVVPRHVIEAYLVDVHGVTTDVGDEPLVPQDETSIETPSDGEGEAFTVSVTIPGHEDIAAEVAQHLVNALWAAFEGGRAAERANILAALGGAA